MILSCELNRKILVNSLWRKLFLNRTFQSRLNSIKFKQLQQPVKKELTLINLFNLIVEITNQQHDSAPLIILIYFV